MQKIDLLIVGAGLYGSTIAYEQHKKGKSVVVIDKRPHIGGNCYTEDVEGIPVHKYGAHIFHTSDKEVWDFINQFCEFNNYVNSPIAIHNNRAYNLPFNMNLFAKVFDVLTPDEAKQRISKEIERDFVEDPQNLEEQAINLVGTTIYRKFIKGYTEKQWGRKCTELPASIIKRLPLRFTFDNNYFRDTYQGVPKKGYTEAFSKMLDGITVLTNTEYLDAIKTFSPKKTIYTGKIDEFYDYKYGKLEYRSLTFESQILDTENAQGNAVLNYPDEWDDQTRTIEHKHFYPDLETKKTVLTHEYSKECEEGDIPYYPIGLKQNKDLYKRYAKLSEGGDVIFGGRLGEYQYLDMDKTIRKALDLSKTL